MDIPLENFLNGMEGIYTKENGRRMERMAVEEDAFTGFFLWNGPFFVWEPLRCV
jgi:hypothetical protein